MARRKVRGCDTWFPPSPGGSSKIGKATPQLLATDVQCSSVDERLFGNDNIRWKVGTSWEYEKGEDPCLKQHHALREGEWEGTHEPCPDGCTFQDRGIRLLRDTCPS